MSDQTFSSSSSDQHQSGSRENPHVADVPSIGQLLGPYGLWPVAQSGSNASPSSPASGAAEGSVQAQPHSGLEAVDPYSREGLTLPPLRDSYGHPANFAPDCGGLPPTGEPEGIPSIRQHPPPLERPAQPRSEDQSSHAAWIPHARAEGAAMSIDDAPNVFATQPEHGYWPSQDQVFLPRSVPGVGVQPVLECSGRPMGSLAEFSASINKGVDSLGVENISRNPTVENREAASSSDYDHWQRADRSPLVHSGLGAGGYARPPQPTSSGYLPPSPSPYSTPAMLSQDQAVHTNMGTLFRTLAPRAPAQLSRFWTAFEPLRNYDLTHSTRSALELQPQKFSWSNTPVGAILEERGDTRKKRDLHPKRLSTRVDPVIYNKLTGTESASTRGRTGRNRGCNDVLVEIVTQSLEALGLTDHYPTGHYSQSPLPIERRVWGLTRCLTSTLPNGGQPVTAFSLGLTLFSLILDPVPAGYAELNVRLPEVWRTFKDECISELLHPGQEPSRTLIGSAANPYAPPNTVVFSSNKYGRTLYTNLGSSS